MIKLKGTKNFAVKEGGEDHQGGKKGDLNLLITETYELPKEWPVLPKYVLTVNVENHWN